MTRTVTLLIVLLAVAPLAGAQDSPIRWGDLSDAEKAISDWPGDPDASAIVLGDVGLAEVEFEGGTGQPRYTLRRHLRVKVLNEGGYDMGEFSMRYHEDSRVRRVRGQTFVPEGDGFRRVELEERDVLDEHVGDETRELRFSMPALTPGAIFEIEYTYTTDGITVIRPWLFQSSEPTLVSEYRFETPVYFDYVALRQGSRVETHPTETLTRFRENLTQQRWTARDVPALREEPFTTTEADYIERVSLQLSRFNRPGGGWDNVLSSWPDVAQDLRRNDYFGRRMRGSRRLRAIAERAEGTVQEKAEALYDIVRTEFVWDGRGGSIFVERDLDDVAESKTGTEAELTMLLLTLYEEAGVPARPVVLSGRSNGRAITEYPILRQFDTMLALVEVPGEAPQLVAPTSPHRPYGEVPVDALNGQAWVVDDESPTWIAFDPVAGTSTTTLARGTLTEDGDFSGTLDLRFTGYDATHLRERLAEAESESPSASGAAVGEATDAEEGAEIETVSVSGEVGEPFMVEATFRAPLAEVVGDEMYVVPYVAMQMDENPFERETREFPVDYAYPRTRTYVADITLPEGWAAIDLPDPMQLSIPSGKVSYLRFIGERPGGVQVRAVLNIIGAQVEPDEYPSLRRLYDEIVAAESEALVIALQAADPLPVADGPETEGGDAEAEAGTDGTEEPGDEAAEDDPTEDDSTDGDDDL